MPLAELVDAAGPAVAFPGGPRTALDRGDAVLAIRIGEAVAERSPDEPGLRPLMASAHQWLLDHGGDESFWEHGWLQTELARWSNG